MNLRLLRAPLLLLAALPLLATRAHADPAFGPGARSLFYGRGHPVVAGSAAVARARWREGVTLLEAAVHDPSLDRYARTRALANLCAGHLGLGQDERAIERCSQAIALDLRDWRSYSNRGLAHLRTGSPGLARCDFERALAIHPGALAPIRGLDAASRHGPGRSRCS